MINPLLKKLISDAVERYSDTVFRVAFQYTRDRSDAEDIVQETFLQFMRTPPPTDDEAWVKAWLIRVTINKGKDFLRANKRKKVARSFPPPSPPENFDEVFEAIGKLSEKDRNALYLHYYEGYTAREIAEITGDSERTVAKRICRAREKLKKFLEE